MRALSRAIHGALPARLTDREPCAVSCCCAACFPMAHPSACAHSAAQGAGGVPQGAAADDRGVHAAARRQPAERDDAGCPAGAACRGAAGRRGAVQEGAPRSVMTTSVQELTPSSARSGEVPEGLLQAAEGPARNRERCGRVVPEGRGPLGRVHPSLGQSQLAGRGVLGSACVAPADCRAGKGARAQVRCCRAARRRRAFRGCQLTQSAWGAGAEMSPGVGVHVGGLAMSTPPNLCLQTVTRMCRRGSLISNLEASGHVASACAALTPRASVPSPVRLLYRVCIYSLPCRRNFCPRVAWCC
jgi:hypothetical protein